MPGLGDWLAQILDLAQGAQGRDLNRGSTAADIADPFRGQRGQYWGPLLDQLLGQPENPHQTELNNLLTKPDSFTMDPGAQFAMRQGLQGVSRAGNAMFGSTRSGNTAIELEKYATGFANDAYNKRIDQLMGITREDNRSHEALVNELMGVSGVNTGSPAAAAQAYLGGFANQDRRLGSGLSGNLLDGIMGMLGQAGGGIMDFFRGLGGSGFDFSGMNLGGSADDFLRSIGLDPSNIGGSFGIDSDIWSSFQNIFGGGDGIGGAGGADFDWGDVSDSTRTILGDIFGGGMP